ncbi:carboxypeptidase-like regulatory domain-containing protein [Bacteroides acidifaciens]|uniref:carboxypeptidase-like regulatory domain-containing protein n=1 Tax=Bacteroides acidifaciens TaxID=85831 RepID=UPI0026F1DDBA|nr:carboxypeptidase-like regulatory domain-containing protein [Bacteroides acidifaciens]
MNRVWIILFQIIFALATNAQTFYEISSGRALTDLSACTEKRLYLNGIACGLVKVQCILEGLTFQGNVIGNVEWKDGEYYVYMSDGSKKLSIRHPKLLPMDFDFVMAFGGDVETSLTYKVVLSIPEALFTSIVVNQNSGNEVLGQQIPASSVPRSTTLSGYIKDEANGDALIGVNIINKRTGQVLYLDFEGAFSLSDLKSGDSTEAKYVGFGTKTIKFTGEIPPTLDIMLKHNGRDTNEEYFYDPNDISEYYDLKGNKLTQRPTKKGCLYKDFGWQA